MKATNRRAVQGALEGKNLQTTASQNRGGFDSPAASQNRAEFSSAAASQNRVRKLALLGASGSVGSQAAELLANRADVQISVLSGGRNAAALQRAIDLLHPQIVLADAAIVSQLRASKVLPNSELAAVLCAEELDGVINATSGFAGLAASLAAHARKLPLHLANKESLVIAAHLLAGADIRPIDSEHSALASLLAGCAHPDELIITASGGAFYELPLEQLERVNAAAALRHPNWAMGAKITIDSATMVNKIYELLEAKALFAPRRLDALIERSSIVHAIVRADDGSVRMYASRPDMRLAVASSVFGEADFAACAPLDLAQMAALKFAPICEQRYALWALRGELLARAELGVVLNAADEAAVAAFLAGECGFLDISRMVAAALEYFSPRVNLETTYEGLCEIDAAVRAKTAEWLK